MMRVAAMFVLLALLSGCAHKPIDPAEASAREYRASSYRAEHPPWGSVAVRNISDRRPAHELGETNYLEVSYASDALFKRSVPATLKRLLVRELVRSGGFIPAQDVATADYLIDLEIFHFFARSDRDVIGLIPVIPSIDVDCEIDIQLRLVDQDGRRFIDQRYEERDDGLAATITGVEATSAKLLYGALSTVMDRVVRDADQSIPAFWDELGLPVP